MHMIMVLKQKEKIPNVFRCFGPSTYKYGLLAVVVLVSGFSICFLHQFRAIDQVKWKWPTTVNS